MYAESPLSGPPAPPTSLLFIHNEHSSYNRRGKQRDNDPETAELARDAGYDVSVVPTSLNQLETNARVHEQYRPGTALIASGGDGTAGIALNALYTLRLNSTYLLFDPKGNANDTARNAHGSATLLDTLQRGHPVAAHAIQTLIQYPSGTMRTVWSASYTGFGGAGKASDRLNVVKNWPLHALWEPFSVWHTVGRHPYFNVIIGDEEEPPIRVTDVTWANARQMAKYGNTGAELTEPEAKVFYSRTRGMASALLRMLKLKVGKLEGRDESGPIKYTVYTDDPDDILHFYHDGETIPIPSETELTNRVDQRRYLTLRVTET